MSSNQWTNIKHNDNDLSIDVINSRGRAGGDVHKCKDIASHSANVGGATVSQLPKLMQAGN